MAWLPLLPWDANTPALARLPPGVGPSHATRGRQPVRRQTPGPELSYVCHVRAIFGWDAEGHYALILRELTLIKTTERLLCVLQTNFKASLAEAPRYSSSGRWLDTSGSPMRPSVPWCPLPPSATSRRLLCALSQRHRLWTLIVRVCDGHGSDDSDATKQGDWL